MGPGKNASVKQDTLERLREKAESLFENKAFTRAWPEAAEAQKLFHELQIQQLELEVQNDELYIVTTELELQKNRFASMFHLAPVGYMVLSSKAAITDINTTGVKLFGIRKDLLTGKLLRSFIHVDDIVTFNSFFYRLVNNQDEQSCQVSLFRLNGETFHAQLNGICINTRSVEPSCYLTITDITEKRIADLKLKEAKQQLDIALRASSTGICEINLDNGEVTLDEFGCSVIGVDPQRFDRRYRNLLNFVKSEERDAVDAAFRNLMVEEKELNIEFQITDTSGRTRYIAIRGQVLEIENNARRFIGTIADITERKQMELETQRLKENQQHLITAAALLAEENERKRVSETLHDSIGQMLYAIKLNLPAFKDSQSSEALNQVNQLLDQTIRDVRNISFELAPSILNDFGLASTLQEMAKRLTSSTLSVQSKVSGFSARMDPTLGLNLFRIVQELVNNCIKHSGGDKITIDLIKKGEHITLQVIDNGQGFSQKPASQQISGTGLSSIRNRLNLYHGTIDVRSQAGKGTTVTIKLKQ